jgi:hypothetical protein
VQNDDCTHTPERHSDEQHSALVVHALPRVLHVVFSAAHAPLTQIPEQQAASSAQACPYEMHAHAPPLQRPLQQSDALAQAAVGPRHAAASALPSATSLAESLADASTTVPSPLVESTGEPSTFDESAEEASPLLESVSVPSLCAPVSSAGPPAWSLPLEEHAVAEATKSSSASR